MYTTHNTLSMLFFQDSLYYSGGMDKEALKQQLKKEGFLVVYEWVDPAGKIYEKHMHQDRVSFYVLRGSVSFVFPDKELVVQKGERIDVSPKVEHTVVVGNEGCEYVVGQMTEDDA